MYRREAMLFCGEAFQSKINGKFFFLAYSGTSRYGLDMPELRDNPHYQQLLNRVIRLEAELKRVRTDEVAPLKEELEIYKTKTDSLHTDVRNLWEAFKLELKNVSTRFGTVDDFLWPVVYKLFPNVRDGHVELAKILKKDTGGNSRKSS